MLEALELLEKEVKRIEKLATTLRKCGLHERADCRKVEAQRLQHIYDIIEVEYYDYFH